MTTPTARRKAWLAAILVPVLAGVTACGDDGDGGGAPANAVTVHYHRALGDYAGWTVAPSAGSTAATVAQGATDGFGATFEVPLAAGAAELTFALSSGAALDPAGPLTVDVSGDVREVWVFSGWDRALPRRPPALPSGPDQAVLYYVRYDSSYAGWGLHTWGNVAPDTSWASPIPPTGSPDPDLGAGFVIDLEPGGAAGNCPPGRLCFIVHKGGEKDPGPDVTSWDPAVHGNIVFQTTGIDELTTFPRRPGEVTIRGAGASLLGDGAVAWQGFPATAASFELRASSDASVVLTPDGVTGGEVIPLTRRAAGLTAAEQALAPQLSGWPVFDVSAVDRARLADGLRGQLVAIARDAAGKPVRATQVQTALALDALYAYEGPLGLAFAGGAPSFALWAPTAQAVTLRILEADDTELAAVPLARGERGEWTHAGDAAWYGKWYRYAVRVYHPATQRIEEYEVTDPYAVNLSTNGRAAQIVDLADPALKPAGWDALVKPALAAPEDVVVYELHVRDFSASDPTVPAALRGKYLAFTDAADAERAPGQKTAGRAHLEALAEAGLTHLHLLPAFDIATVNEDPAARVDLDDPFADLCAANPSTPTALCGAHAGQTIRAAMATYAGDSDQQQLVASLLAGLDAFNWGYDPLHYGAPEGSYATTAEGTAKILEFRRMVQGIAALGLRTVMDVVYNHTNASGVGDRSVLDKVVPGYYHRLNVESGAVTTSSCCANTATEHRMMERLMVDTLVRWAREYKVDGFRFDLMGLHTKENMIRVRDALAALDPTLYLYGEGWTMGDAPGQTPATQQAMDGTGIGTFNDRLRDGVRGGGPFDSGDDLRRRQGFATGMYTDPNELAAAYTSNDLAAVTDWIKVGMAGNLAAFRYLDTAGGAARRGDYPGYAQSAPIGYGADPQEAINYVSKHDNQTIFDIAQYKLPAGTPMAQRVRVNTIALATVMLGQGIPFFHAGDDLLRSKSMERDSYDSGDWFNRVDWSGATNGWEVGLPNAGKDEANWPLVRARFADPSIVPAPADVAAASAAFRDLLRVRKSSPLFRLRTAAEVQTRVDFHNAGAGHVPGVIAMTITDAACAGPDLDPERDAVVVVINADDAEHGVTIPGAAGLSLHALLADGVDADPALAGASASGETITVPGRTAAVFEQRQAATRGAGLPCNTR